MTTLQEFCEQITTFAGKAVDKLRSQDSYVCEMAVQKSTFPSDSSYSMMAVPQIH